MVKDKVDELTVPELKQWFPKLFSGKLGCLEGVEARLDVDETVKPVRQPQRPVPFHLREAVAKAIGARGKRADTVGFESGDHT